MQIMSDIEAVPFRDRARWRRWLSKNHGSASELWLLFYKKASGVPSITLPEATEEAICFGWIDGKLKSLDENRYMLRFTPRRPGGLWSKINKDRALRLIKEGKMTPAGMAAVDDGKRSGNWQRAYSTRVKVVAPPDLKRALAKSPEAKRFFEAMPNSHRFQYIGWILDAKRLETRERRIRETVRRLLAGKRPGEP